MYNMCKWLELPSILSGLEKFTAINDSNGNKPRSLNETVQSHVPSIKCPLK